MLSSEVTTGQTLAASQYNNLRTDTLRLAAFPAGTTPDWSSGASLNPATAHNFLSNTLPAGQTLTVSTVNIPLLITTQGNVTINGTVDLAAKGAPGMTNGIGIHSTFITNKGGNGSSSGGMTVPGGGGGGGSGIAAGSSGGGVAPGGGGAAADSTTLALLANIQRTVLCGAGGGKGGGGTGGSPAGGDGGIGGGALVWRIGGNLALGESSIISANGGTGVAGTNAPGNVGSAGGGGGGGGMIVILVYGTITNSGLTFTASGGGGGSGGTGSIHGGGGGSGGAGRAMIYSLTDGTLILA
jgi:hypothetical protein